MKYLYVSVLTTPSGPPKIRRPELWETFSEALAHIQLLSNVEEQEWALLYESELLDPKALIEEWEGKQLQLALVERLA